MSDRLSRRAIALLLGVAFGLTFTVQLLLSDGSSAPARKVSGDVPAVVAGASAAAPKPRLVAAGTVPALRQPRKPRASRTPQPTPTATPRVAEATPTVEPEPITPAATVQPTPTAAPPYIPPRPQPTPRPRPVVPKATPAPAPPPSGDFDLSGDS